MGYRGQDLDLRTPQTWRAAPADLGGTKLNGPRGRTGYAADDDLPIWVDDTVLACSNHAYDVALAHRAGEVRLEHLIHAMTRIDDATEALEASGVRVAALRREIATIIASEIPVGLGSGSATPRSSDGFVQVLRLASAHARQNDAPASVQDVLYVLLELRPQGNAAELIDRHMVRLRERTERVTPPPYRRPAAPAYVPVEPQRERVRRPAGRYFVSETGTAQPADPLQNVTDNLQNTRLDALEQMVRAISSQITNQRDDASRFSGGVFDRLQSLETLVTTQPQYDGGAIDALLRRLDDIEHAVRKSLHREPHVAVDLSPITARLEQIESRLDRRPTVDLGAVTARLDQIEQSVRNVPVTDVSHLASRLDQIEQGMRNVPVTDVSQLAGRLDQIEYGVRNIPVTDVSSLSSRLDQIEWNVRQTPFIDFSPLNMRIDQVEHLVRSSQPVVNVDLSAVDQRVADVERNLGYALSQGLDALAGRVDSRSDLATISNRLDIIEEAVLGQDGQMAGDLDSRMSALADTLSLQQTTLEDVRASLTADVREVAASLVEQSSRIARTGEGIAELVRIVESERTDDATALATMSEKLQAYRAAIEGFAVRSDTEAKTQRELLIQHRKDVEAYGLRTGQAMSAHQAELKEVHDALMKLNANQHTLAGSIDQWRSDGAGDLAIVASRIETLEQEAGKPMALLTTLSSNMENLNRLTVERYHRRNRFWYWLFGTDDWVAASWPSQMEKIEAERRALRPVGR
jgi:tetrahydromethanopterin S-methyltransferase subunit G